MKESKLPSVLIVGRDKDARQQFLEGLEASFGECFEFEAADPRDAVFLDPGCATIHVRALAPPSLAAASSGKRIVLVDDDETVLISLRADLEKEFGRTCVFRFATSGPDGLSILEEIHAEGGRPALLTSCYNMPGMNGPEFLELAMVGHHGMPTVLVSSDCESKEIMDLFSRGILDAHLPKPWEPEALCLVARILTQGSAG